MGGPTNTQPRYRPPPPGMAPPPPPPPASNDGAGFMGGGPPPQQHPHQQYHQPPPQQQSYYAQHQRQPQQSYYVQQQQQQTQPSYYAQQQPQQPQPQQPQQQQQPPSRTAIPGSNQSYAARSAAAQGQVGNGGGNNTVNNLSNHSAHSNGNVNTNKPKPKPTSKEESPAVLAEQSRLLNLATQKITEHAYHMQRSMENNDVCSALEKATLLLEELGDPNHGMHHRGGTGNRGGPGGGVVGGVPQGGPPFTPGPPNYYSQGGAVPPLGNYGDRPYPYAGPGGGMGGGGHGLVTPLSPKNYYELHMRAMDEMPGLEEYLLGLCHVPGSGGAGPTGATNQSGPTNYSSANGGSPMMAQYSTDLLYETVQYCPRVVPRLYLQICMGAVSIRAGSTPALQVMEELGEASKCVQCPVRGLFLRYYLLMALKDKLPDGSLEEEQESKKEEQAEANEVVMTPLTPVEAGEEILGGSAQPTSPPPELPPPPPPATESALFPETEAGGDAPLFSDSPLVEEPKKVAPTPQTSSKKPEVATVDVSDPPKYDPNNPRDGTVIDSYNFILNNLLEMNRLWIRIQHLPGDKTKETKRRRERERNDLRILVGSNLNRLSQLEGVTAHMYGSKILPRILEEVASCRDPLAQAYLMDCIIQVFPDEFHLETLEVFLGVCPKLREKVNVRTILNNMMERLLHYYQEEKLVNDEEDTNDVKFMMALHSFDMFEECVQRVYEARGLNIPPKDVIRLQGCLLKYALKIAPHNSDLIKRCISVCARALGTLQEQKKASMMGHGIVLGGGTKKSMELDMETIATTALEDMLSVPLDSMGLQVLDMPDFGALLAFLPWENRRKVAVSMVKSMIGGGDAKKVKDVTELEQLFTILAPLLRDEGMAAPAMYDANDHAGQGGSLISRTANLMGTLGITPSAMDHDELFGGSNNIGGMMPNPQNFGGDVEKLVQFREEQTMVAKLVHVLNHEDTDVVYQMLTVARKHIQSGGSTRFTITLPPVVFAALSLLRRVQASEFPEPIVVTKEKKEAKKEESKDVDGSEAESKEGEEEKTECESENEAAAKKESQEKDGEATSTSAGEDGTTEKSNPTTEGDSEQKEDEKQRDSAKEVEEVDGCSKPSQPLADEEPTQLFPKFTKSVNCRKILVFLQKSIAILAPANPELAFKLYLEIAMATDQIASSTITHFPNSSPEFTSIAYDFLTQAFLVYEDEISESHAQIRAITSIVGVLLSCQTFDRTDYEALITKTAQYSAKLLKKPDQCRMVCLCSRLFYVVRKDDANDANAYRNPQRVLECLQRGLKIADACSMSSSSNVQLFVEILDYYVYYYGIGNPAITDKFVSGLIALINEHFDSIGSSTATIAETRAHYGQILDQIKKKKMEEGSKERFGLIVC
mmetsp:Transcript_3728/g.8220  ORF Transcript_3728/g.8220 Transcript_3728/m.8220 type:complete len:1386 (+) Transcript_3728:131-4288(+)